MTAGERTRTSTGVTPPGPKPGASANSATPAGEKIVEERRAKSEGGREKREERREPLRGFRPYRRPVNDGRRRLRREAPPRHGSPGNARSASAGQRTLQRDGATAGSPGRANASPCPGGSRHEGLVATGVACWQDEWNCAPRHGRASRPWHTWSPALPAALAESRIGSALRPTSPSRSLNLSPRVRLATSDPRLVTLPPPMPVTGLEPVRPCGHRHLRTARLPIPPHGRARLV